MGKCRQSRCHTLRARLERLKTAHADHKHAQDQEIEARKSEGEAKSALETSTTNERSKANALATCRSAALAAERALTAAQETLNRKARAASIQRAREQLTRVQALETEIEELQLITGAEITQEDLEGLQDLERSCLEARAHADAGATIVEIELLEQVPVEVGGQITTEQRHELIRRTEIQIGSVAKLNITPSTRDGRSANAAVEAARAALSTRLNSLGMGSTLDASERLRSKEDAEQKIGGLRREIAALCPGDHSVELRPGINELKAFLADCGDELGDECPDVDVVGIQANLASARDTTQEAEGEHETALQLLRNCEVSYAAAAAAATSAKVALEAAQRRYSSEAAETNEEALTGELADARKSVLQASSALKTAEANAGTLNVEAIKKRIQNISQARQRADEERLELIKKRSALEATVTHEGSEGPAGALEAAEEELRGAEGRHSRLSEQADVLSLLRDTLKSAGDAATAKFLGPVTRRAAGYIERILPGCEALFNHEMGLSGIHRQGLNEDCTNLSRGTQEQLAILTRLAFADLLLEKGAPVSLILDDPLVYSDDVRLENVTDILENAAERMQVILLTCRSKAFRHVGGQSTFTRSVAEQRNFDE